MNERENTAPVNKCPQRLSGKSPAMPRPVDRIISAGSKDGYLKSKVFRLSASTLGFKSFVR